MFYYNSRKTWFQLVSERLQVLQHMEDVKVREMQIFDYKKKIAEAETKLKQQQNLYEAVRSDRNLYSKNLIESQVWTNNLFDDLLYSSRKR